MYVELLIDILTLDYAYNGKFKGSIYLSCLINKVMKSNGRSLLLWGGLKEITTDVATRKSSVEDYLKSNSVVGFKYSCEMSGNF